MPLLSQSDVDAILRGRWSFDCLRMTLVQQRTEQIKYSGPGCIRHDSDGQLEYLLYDTTAKVEFGDFFRGGESGEFLKEEHFYRLNAFDMQNNEWVASWVDADTSSHFDYPGCTVTGRIRELRCDSKNTDEPAHAIFQTLSEVSTPTNAVTETIIKRAGRESKGLATDVWRSPTSLGDVFILKDQDVLKVELHADSPTLPNEVGTRFEEAISFVLGQHVKWIVEHTVADGHARLIVRSPKGKPGRPRLRPPIEPNMGGRDDVGVLLDRFLTHVVRTAPPPSRRHPLAVGILLVLAASAGTLEHEALTLAVRVEGLIRDHFWELGSPDADTVSQVNSALKHFRRWEGSIRERILNSVGQVKGTDARTALRSLERQGLIEERHRVAWEGIRPRVAHGSVAIPDLQVLSRQCDLVAQLFLLLVFKVIGYEGQFTDHTKTGWPLSKVQGSSVSASEPREPFDPTSRGDEDGETM